MHAIREFEQNGFLLLPHALSTAQVKELNAAVDRYRAEYPEEWVHFSESFIQTVDVLPNVAGFDAAIENPAILDVLRGLIGDDLTFEEFSIILRNPTREGSDHKSWHRDITREYDRRMEIDAISMVYYLTDVTETDHCFSIIPGTHGPLVDLRPEDVRPGMEVDLTGAAGTAFLFHARSIHSGKLKPQSRQRRTLHVYYSRAGKPRTSEWTRIPARLYEKHDPSLPAFLYSKWNSTDIFEGTGRKPRDLDPAMPAVEMLREVQRRANRRQAVP
ncbi:MAG: phytanoyl-CoA dioxygenase family protein [Bryobacteraceae bacterium]